jgi:hypothetical protein
MLCSEIQERVSALLDNRLEKADRAVVEHHLQECRECRRYFNALRQVQERSKQALSRQPSQAYWDGLPDRIMARLPAASASRSSYRIMPGPRWVWRGLAYASVLGLLVGVTVVAYRAAHNREQHQFSFGKSFETVELGEKVPAAPLESKAEKPALEEFKRDKALADKGPAKPVGGIDAASAAGPPAKEQTMQANHRAAQSADLSRTNEQPALLERAGRPDKPNAPSSPKQVSAVTLSKTAASLQESDSHFLQSGSSGAVPVVAWSNSAGDKQKLLTGYLHALQSGAGRSLEQRNKLILQAAALFHYLAVNDTLRSLRPGALSFYKQYHKVLIDSLGEQTVRKQMQDLGNSME